MDEDYTRQMIDRVDRAKTALNGFLAGSMFMAVLGAVIMALLDIG